MMRFKESQSNLIYFGKVPSRGDFVRTAQAGPIIQVFDQWLSGAMELLSTDPRWKLIYDGHDRVNFAFFDNEASHFVAGTLACSQDSSSRRFPFICAVNLESEPSLEAVRTQGKGLSFRGLPLYLAHIWAQTEHWVTLGMSDVTEVTLKAFSEASIRLDNLPPTLTTRYQDFCDSMSVDSIQSLLEMNNKEVNLRQTVMGLGLLLQPTLANRGTALNKGLCLPLPHDEFFVPLMSSFWMDLLYGFTQHMDAEFSLLKSCGIGSKFCIGFNGASSRALHAQFVADDGECQIDIAAADWVEQYIDSDYGLKKLSIYLQHPGLSLTKLKETFNEVFLGK